MILVDAIYINNGGGKVLLDYLIHALEQTDKKIYYLLDERYELKETIFTNKVEFVRAGFLQRRKFYKDNKHTFTTVLCFGNLPPNIKIEAKVFTYFHQPMFLAVPSDFGFVDRLKFGVKTQILNGIKNNTDVWLVQSELMRTGLARKYRIEPEKILKMPFYPPLTGLATTRARKKCSYLYATHAPAHKNHIRLIDAFCEFYDRYRVGQLTLTVGPQFNSIVEMIERKIDQGYPIINVGFINREELHNLYLSSEFLVYPSLAESFGLALVEAIENGCKIIGADLPYTYEVCKPSIIFDPMDHQSLIQAFEKSIGNNIPESIQVINNKISELVNLLK